MEDLEFNDTNRSALGNTAGIRISDETRDIRRDGSIGSIGELINTDRPALGNAAGIIVGNESWNQISNALYVGSATRRFSEIAENLAASITQSSLNTFYVPSPTVEILAPHQPIIPTVEPDEESTSTIYHLYRIHDGLHRAIQIEPPQSDPIPDTSSNSYHQESFRTFERYEESLTASTLNSFHRIGTGLNDQTIERGKEEFNLENESYETLLKQLYNIPVIQPTFLILNGLRVYFISFQEVSEMLSQNKVSKYIIEPILQPWAGPPLTQNRILTIFGTNGMTYLVKALYDQASNQIFPPI